jgi:putative transposase
VPFVRYRLLPSDAQEEGLRSHCVHTRYVWNLALEQANCWRRHLGPTPGNGERMRQLTEARRSSWLAEGCAQIQQQALRDFDQGMRNWWAGTHRRPTWRRKGVHEGFRVVQADREPPQRLNRHFGQMAIPKVGWVRFRLTRPLPKRFKSFRVTCDRAGRWHVAFALKPDPVEGPGDGSVVGIDRGVVIPYQCSDGRAFDVPALTVAEAKRERRLEQQIAKRAPGSGRRERSRLQLARLKAREADRRKDAIEKATTELARTVDLIRLEDLRVKTMTRSAKGTLEAPGHNVRQKARLNRSILAQGWSVFARRLGDKAPGRVELVPAAHTSQECPQCHHVDKNNRKSQALFACVGCGLVANADLVGAINIARGTPGASARRPSRSGVDEPRIQPAAAPSKPLGIPTPQGGEDVKARATPPADQRKPPTSARSRSRRTSRGDVDGLPAHHLLDTGAPSLPPEAALLVAAKWRGR